MAGRFLLLCFAPSLLSFVLSFFSQHWPLTSTSLNLSSGVPTTAKLQPPQSFPSNPTNEATAAALAPPTSTGTLN